MTDWAENRALGVVGVDSTAVRLYEYLPHDHPSKSRENEGLRRSRLQQSVRAALGYGYTIEEISRIAHRTDDEVIDIAIGPSSDAF